MLPKPSGSNNPYKSLAVFYCLFWLLGMSLIGIDSMKEIRHMPFTLALIMFGATIVGPLFFTDNVKACLDKIGSTSSPREMIALIANYAFRRGIYLGVAFAIVRFVFRSFFL